MTEPTDRPVPRLNVALLVAAYGALLTALLWLLARSITNGGNPWQQGDWLINYGGGIVRRGLSGHLILGLSEATGADPLILLGVLQGGLVAALLFGVFHAAISLRVPDRILVLLVSPAFLPFWAYDYLGAIRKETLTLLAFVPLLIPARWPGLRAALALAAFSFAVAFHEANAFLAPFLAVALWIAMPTPGLRKATIAATLAIAVAGTAFALAFSTVENPDAVCAALVAAGMRPGLCGGAISWLGFDLARVLEEGATRLDHFGFPWSIFLSYALALAPVGVALWRAPDRTRLLLAVVGSAVFLAPLYVVALDWGRWVFLHIACVTLVIVVVAGHRRPVWLLAPLPSNGKALLLAASLLWSMAFFTGETAPGLLQRLAGLALPGDLATGSD